MFPANYAQSQEVADRRNILIDLPVAVEVQPDQKIARLLADLSPNNPWGDRRNAAMKLGEMRSQEALPGLLVALPADPFWMVRCSIIQAVEMIDDPAAIPVLNELAHADGFQVVRSYAAKVVQRLSI